MGLESRPVLNTRDARILLLGQPNARENITVVTLPRMGQPFLVLSRNTTTLLDADGHRVLYQWDRGKSTISYAGYDAARTTE